MFKKNNVIIGVATGVAFLTLSNSNSVEAASLTPSLTIDTFSNSSGLSQSIQVRRSTSGLTSSSQLTTTTALGGYRDLALTNVSGLPTSTASTKKASATVNQGNLSWDNDTNIWSDLAVTWDGNDSPASLNKQGLASSTPAGLEGLDITKSSRLEGIFVNILSPDTTANTYANLNFDIYDLDGRKYSLSKSVASTSIINNKKGLFFDFTKFTINGNASQFTTEKNFQNIGAIQMNLTPNKTTSSSKGVDLRFNLIEAIDTQPEVPEPTTSLITLGGVMLLGARTWKKRGKKER